MTKIPSARQQAVYDFIVEYQDQNECSPSVREIAEALGMASTNTVAHHINGLVEKGLLSKREHSARNLMVVDRPADGYSRPRSIRSVRLQVRGLIAAGQPIEALDDRDDYLDLPESLVGSRDAYVLRVRGTSMIDEHICNGDLVVIRPQATARDGEIVVALLAGNTVTLKKFFNEGTHIRLQPANATMAPILIRKGEDIAIQGIVRAVIRQAA